MRAACLSVGVMNSVIACYSEIDCDGGDREELYTSHPGNIMSFNIRSVSVCIISHERTHTAFYILTIMSNRFLGFKMDPLTALQG